MEYINLEAEAPAETVTKPKDDWPSRGQIDFDDMSFRYHRSLPDVLHTSRALSNPVKRLDLCSSL